MCYSEKEYKNNTVYNSSHEHNKEQLNVLFRQEKNMYICDYIRLEARRCRRRSSSSSSNSLSQYGIEWANQDHNIINNADIETPTASTHTITTHDHTQALILWRQKITEWSFRTADHFGYDREVVDIAMNYVDRYLSSLTSSRSRSSHRCRRASEPFVSSHPLSSSESTPIRRSASSLLNDSSPVSPISPNACFPVDMQSFQLLGMTCLYLAIKIHGYNEIYDNISPDNGSTSSSSSNSYQNDQHGKDPKLFLWMSMNDFAQLSRGLFTEHDLEVTEKSILNELEWRLNPPTLSSFIVSFLGFLNLDDHYEGTGETNKLYVKYKYMFRSQNQLQQTMKKKNSKIYIPKKHIKFALYELTRYLTELSKSVYELSVNHKPSWVCMASIIISSEIIISCDHTMNIFLHNVLSVRRGTTNQQQDHGEKWLEHVFRTKQVMEEIFQDIFFASYQPILKNIVQMVQHTHRRSSSSSNMKRFSEEEMELDGLHHIDSPTTANTTALI